MPRLTLDDAARLFKEGKITEAQLKAMVNTILEMPEEPDLEDRELAEMWERSK